MRHSTEMLVDLVFDVIFPRIHPPSCRVSFLGENHVQSLLLVARPAIQSMNTIDGFISIPSNEV